MSVIANFQKYYKDTDPALDLFDVIVSIYKWFYRNMWERRVQYMKTGKVIPIATSDFPGQDFGFMPVEAVFYTRSCFRTMYSNKKSAAISSEGCVIQLPDSVSEELSLTNAYSILWMGNQTHCTIPIAVNNEWGDVLYATCPIMPAEEGSTFMLDKSCSVYSLYDFSKIIIVSTLSAERRVLYNAVAGVLYDKNMLMFYRHIFNLYTKLSLSLALRRWILTIILSVQRLYLRSPRLGKSQKVSPDSQSTGIMIYLNFQLTLSFELCNMLLLVGDYQFKVQIFFSECKNVLAMLYRVYIKHTKSVTGSYPYCSIALVTISLTSGK